MIVSVGRGPVHQCCPTICSAESNGPPAGVTGPSPPAGADIHNMADPGEIPGIIAQTEGYLSAAQGEYFRIFIT